MRHYEEKKSGLEKLKVFHGISDRAEFFTGIRDPIPLLVGPLLRFMKCFESLRISNSTLSRMLKMIFPRHQ